MVTVDFSQIQTVWMNSIFFSKRTSAILRGVSRIREYSGVQRQFF